MQKDALNHTSINSTIQLVTGKRHGVDVGTTWPILLMNKLFCKLILFKIHLMLHFDTKEN